MLLIRRLLHLSEFKTHIGAAAHATLEADQLTSHTRSTIVDTITSLQDTDEKVILVSEVYDLLNIIIPF